MPFREQFQTEEAFHKALRDYMAAKAMQGWLASFGPDVLTVDEDGVALMAYRIADAMLAARKEES